MGGRSKAVWNFFWKFIRFGTLTRPSVNLKAATPQKKKISPVPQMILTIIFFSYRSQNSGELFPKGPASNSIILKKVTLFQGIRQSEPRDPRSSKVYKVIRIQLQQSKERGGVVFEIFNLAGVAVMTLVVCCYCVWSEKVGTDWMFYGTSTSWKIEKNKQKQRSWCLWST